MKASMIAAAFLAIAFWGCDTKEKQAMQAKIDSLYTEVQEHDELLFTLQEVGTLLDSIDINRQVLHTNMVEGTTYQNFTERLNNINSYVRQTAERIEMLEKKITDQSKGYALTIKKLKADLEASAQQVVALQQETEKMREGNKGLLRTLSQRDSLVAVQTETIRLKESNITSLDARITEINKDAKVREADLLFAQAEALELAASRTKLAPRKKKTTQREALELYKMSLTLGKTEAESRIASLEEAI